MNKNNNIQMICVKEKILDKLLTGIKDKMIKEEKNNNNSKRQLFYQDYGYSGGVSHVRYDQMSSESAISSPTIRKGTSTKFIQRVFIIASNMITSYCPWIWSGISGERKDTFSQSIHKDNNYVEAIRFALYYFDINDMEMTKKIYVQCM